MSRPDGNGAPGWARDHLSGAAGWPSIQRESIEDALENDRCGICGSVDHFREDHPTAPAAEPDLREQDVRRALEGTDG